MSWENVIWAAVTVGMVLIVTVFSIQTYILPMSIQIPKTLSSTSAMVGSLKSACVFWKINGLFVDTYMPATMSDNFGTISTSCTSDGVVDPQICKNKCIALVTLTDFCSPSGPMFGMECVEGGDTQVRVILEGA